MKKLLLIFLLGIPSVGMLAAERSNGLYAIAAEIDGANTTGNTADENSVNKEVYSEDPRPARTNTYAVYFDTNFNTKDWMAGFGLGIFGPWDIALIGKFQGRLFSHSVFVEKSTNTYRQYQERRFLFAAVLDKEFLFFGSGGIYLNGGYGISDGYYRGTDEDAQSKWTPLFGTGFTLRLFPHSYVRFGYEYFRTPALPSNHVNISVMLKF